VDGFFTALQQVIATWRSALRCLSFLTNAEPNALALSGSAAMNLTGAARSRLREGE
jgi:hypothetical protein